MIKVPVSALLGVLVISGLIRQTHLFSGRITQIFLRLRLSGPRKCRAGTHAIARNPEEKMAKFDVRAESHPGSGDFVTIIIDAPDRESALFAAGYNTGIEIYFAALSDMLGIPATISESYDLSDADFEFGSILAEESAQ
jgi:hypothetical protein